MKASVLLIACGFASAALGLAGSATAQPLHFEVEGIEADALTDALREDLGRPITFEEGRPRLRIVVAEGRQATLTYRARDGAERTRTVVISRDHEAAIEELTLVGSNLVRDQTEGLIVDAPALDAPAPEPAVVSSDEGPIDEVHETTLSLAQAHPMHMGIAGYLGVQVQSSAAGSNARPFGTFGVSLSGTVNEMVSVGVTRLAPAFSYSSIGGGSATFGLEGTPFVELFAFLDPRVQVYGQLGVALQGRSQSSYREGFLQVAPFLGGGLRFWVFDTFSFGVELGAHLVLTDAYFTMGATLPQFSVPGTIGISLEWHIDP